MIYDVTEHPMLTDTAKQLHTSNSEQFVAQVEVAELLLKTPDPLPGQQKVRDKLLLAVALQVNFQVKQGIDPLYIKSSSSPHAGNSVSYTGAYIDPRARDIVAFALGLVGMNFSGKITSVRNQGFKSPIMPSIRDVIP